MMSVLNNVLEKHPHPEIFNTDQGGQYTSEIHTQRLKKLGITISMVGLQITPATPQGVLHIVAKR